MQLITEQSLKQGILKSWLVNPLRRLEIEVGSSTGNFLCRLAKPNQTTRFIGVDINYESCQVAIEKILSLHLSNVRIVYMEARKFVEDHVSTNSVAAMHIFFPTPSRHPIRINSRLVNRQFLEEVYRVLISGGVLRIVTDDSKYFREINTNLQYLPWWDADWSLPAPLKSRPGFVIPTPSERTYRVNSRIHTIQVVK